MSCSRCFEDWLCKCLPYDSSITVNAILPVGNYTVVITDKFNNKYSSPITVYDQGSFELNIADFPEGIFTQHSGQFKMEIQDANCKPINFKMAQEYDCIDFEIKGGTFEKSNIGCDFECISSSTQSALVAFDTAAIVTIDWDDYRATYGNNPVIQVYHETSPDVFQLVDVSIETVFVDGILDEIIVNNGGNATGYIVIS